MIPITKDAIIRDDIVVGITRVYAFMAVQFDVVTSDNVARGGLEIYANSVKCDDVTSNYDVVF